MMERTFRHWYKACKYTVKSKYKQWIRSRIEHRDWYQNYRARRIDFKIWRYHQGWHRYLMRWRLRLSDRAYLRDRSKAAPGTADWLIDAEIRYGGKVWAVSIKNSPVDPGGPSDMAVGGDRMLHQGYANHYERFLRPYVRDRDKRIVFCEVGVLEGTGLAIWCDLFPNARCIGLDVDLSNFRRNMDNLRSLGAFGGNTPELFEYDQFVYSEEYVKEILNGDRIDVFADDGNHSEKAIMTTLSSVAPHLSERFVYFVEDNWDVHKVIEQEYPDWTVHSDCGLTVMVPSKDTRYQ